MPLLFYSIVQQYFILSFTKHTVSKIKLQITAFPEIYTELYVLFNVRIVMLFMVTSLHPINSNPVT